MTLSAFDDKSRQPTEADLARALKGTFIFWKELKRRIASRFGPLTYEWGFSSKSTGWGLRLKHKERIILYMTPCQGYFLASFALGDKAVEVARAGNVPASIMKAIESAKRYAEGRGVRLKVSSARDVRNIEKLAVIKMSS
ncbi:MAG TPA: DUF3788 family protein [Pyrinomonadaceae bacterium]|nr:DUF3788 family protein [Pyrinomonadaceae bacterium]